MNGKKKRLDGKLLLIKNFCCIQTTLKSLFKYWALIFFLASKLPILTVLCSLLLIGLTFNQTDIPYSDKQLLFLIEDQNTLNTLIKN